MTWKEWCVGWLKTASLVVVVFGPITYGIYIWTNDTVDAQVVPVKVYVQSEVKRLDGRIDNVVAKIDEVRRDLKEDIKEVRKDLKADIGTLDSKIEGAKKEIKEDIQKVNDLLIKVLAAPNGSKIVLKVPTEK